MEVLLWRFRAWEKMSALEGRDVRRFRRHVRETVGAAMVGCCCCSREASLCDHVSLSLRARVGHHHFLKADCRSSCFQITKDTSSLHSQHVWKLTSSIQKYRYHGICIATNARWVPSEMIPPLQSPGGKSKSNGSESISNAARSTSVSVGISSSSSARCVGG